MGYKALMKEGYVMSGLDFKKKHEHIVCIDSDGCAMDTMNIKHYRCFGPCMIKEWGLEKWEKEILEKWNEINLFSMTRGINRFKGLALCLLYVDENYRSIEGVKALKTWSDDAPELSNNAVSKMTEVSPVFEKALNWSKSVNASIEELPKEEIKPFEGVKEAFEEVYGKCDIAVVSSANPEAVRAEWERFGLLDMVDIVCTQEMGSKSAALSMIRDKGYAEDHILMVGDAPGDLQAAMENGVYFYPILVRHEAESWSEFAELGLKKFLSDDYREYGNRKMDEFRNNLA